MSTYAQPADLRAYTAMSGLLALTDSQLDTLLKHCERDLDQVLFPPVLALTTSSRKVDLVDLDVQQTLALKNATCAQAEYRFTMGEEFFIRAQYRQAGGPGGFSQVGRMPIIGPKVKRELTGTGLLPFGAQSSPARGRIR